MDWTMEEKDLLESTYKNHHTVGGKWAIPYPESLLERHGRAGVQKMASKLQLTNKRKASRIDLSNWTSAEMGYFAGILDGEGCISMWEGFDKRRKRNRISVRVMVSNTHVGLLKWLKEKIGDGCYFRAIRHIHKHKTWKDSYTFVISSHNDVVNVLTELLPYLIVKKEKAEETLAYLETRE